MGLSFDCFLAVHSFLSSLAQSDLAAACQICFLLYELNDPSLLRLILRDLASHDDPSKPLAPILAPILGGEVSNRLYRSPTPSTPSIHQLVVRLNHHDSRLFEDYVRLVHYADTNVQHAMMVAHGMANIGGTDEFVMNHISWLKEAENWTKFGIISSFALSHVFDPEKAQEHLRNYLTSEKEEELGGGYYGFSILMMGEGEGVAPEICTRMHQALETHPNKEMVVHASALGLGLIDFGSMDPELTDLLLNLLAVSTFPLSEL